MTRKAAVNRLIDKYTKLMKHYDNIPFTTVIQDLRNLL